MTARPDNEPQGTVHVGRIDGSTGPVGLVTIDFPPINAGSRAMRAALLQAFADIDTSGLTGVVLRGAGRYFVGGADLREFDAEAQEPHLPEVIAAIEHCPVPVVAAIDGAALGGGYELALGCDARVATATAVVGLPEVTLGLIPGAGGTFRLPRIVGRAEGIRLITSGRRVPAREAAELGMIDAVADGDLLAGAVAHLQQMEGKRVLRNLPVVEEDPADIEAAAAEALRKARGAVAVGEAIEAIGDSASLPVDEALRKERERSLRLRRGPQSRSLRHLFFAERKAGRIEGRPEPREVARAGVVGAGRMGQGIALAFADAGFDVALVDSDAGSLAAGLDAIRATARQRGARPGGADADAALDRIAAAELSDLAGADLVVEAIVEDMEAKRALFSSLEQIVGSDAILASNTSYLDIDAIAAGLRHPERVAGMHFFNPAHVMRLVEVIRTEKGDASVLATLVRVARRMGKVPVLAGISDGFIGNRMFAAYRQQCEFLLEEGATPRSVDDAMRGFGMAMGPFAVFDLAGLDIAWARRKRIAATRNPDERYVCVPDRLCEMGRFGRKSGRGWYDYTNEPAGADDPDVTALIEEESREKDLVRRDIAPEEIVARLMAALVNTAADLLQEGVAERSGDIDLVWVHGYGFPKLKGGPLWWAAEQEAGAVRRMVCAMAEASGPGIEVSKGLDAMLAAAGEM